jgi:hypothetical protein
MDQRVQQTRRVFFSEQNEAMLYGMLTKNFQQRLGTQLNDKQTSRLERGLEHYMSEVFTSNTTLPIQNLNKEVLAVTASDFNDYLQRQDAVAQAPPNTFQETSQRYDQIQVDRQRTMETPRPAIPDYVQPMIIKEDDSVSALSLFEEAKKRRNMETNAQAEEQLTKRANSALQPLYLEQAQERPDPRAMFDKPLDMVVAGSMQRELPGRGDGNPTLARPGPTVALRGALQQDIIIKQEDIQSYKETEYNLSIYSADRSWESDLNNNESRFNFSVNLNSSSSPTGVNMMPKAANRFKNIVRIEFVKAIIPIENTDLIVRKTTSTYQPDLLQTMITAHTIAVTSINAGVSTAPVTAANAGQKNLELMDAKNTLLTNAVCRYDTQFMTNVYSYPFITLNISELDTNTYGTSSTMDNAFGILQYDSNWSDKTDSLGFTSLIPKHMKCQRIYAPTPLASLNKLTIRLQQPNGKLLNTLPDTLDISGIFLSKYTSIRTYCSSYDLSGTGFSDVDGEYIWIDCKKWFSRFQVNVGDRIQIKNLTPQTTTPRTADLINFLQDDDGLLVAGIAFARTITAAELISDGLTPNQLTNGLATGVANHSLATSVLVDGSNNVGYARYIIVRGKFTDPTTGSIAISPYGGGGVGGDNTIVGNEVVTGTTKLTSGKLINLSRQTQLIFRVITREYDSTSLIRPDNL